VFGDPLTAGLKPISNGETSAQRGMRNEVPAIRGVISNLPATRLSRPMRLGIQKYYVSEMRCAAEELWRDQQGESLGDNVDSDWQCAQ
jgi:hypothetical protein